MYKNRVKNDKKIFYFPTILFCEIVHTELQSEKIKNKY